MRYVKVESNKIISSALPTTGVLKDGSTVSNYHLLPKETLLDEGWMPLESKKVTYDEITHYIQGYSYKITKKKVTEIPIIAEIAPQNESGDPTEAISPEERITQLEKQVQELLSMRGE